MKHILRFRVKRTKAIVEMVVHNFTNLSTPIAFNEKGEPTEWLVELLINEDFHFFPARDCDWHEFSFAE